MKFAREHGDGAWTMFELRQLPLGRIRPNPRNARTHSADQIRQMANSIAAFGFTNSLLASEHLEVIAGHGR